MNRILALAVCLLLLALAACAGGNLRLKASHTGYPVSFSPAVFAPNGELRYTGGYKVIGSFSKCYERWSLFWTLIPLSAYERDISDDLNEAIRAAGGDGAVNFQARVTTPKINSLLSATLLSILPLTPSVHRVYVSADIISLMP